MVNPLFVMLVFGSENQKLTSIEKDMEESVYIYVD